MYNVPFQDLPQQDMLDGLHFLVQSLNGEPLVLLAALVPRLGPAIGDAIAAAVLHGRESDEVANLPMFDTVPKLYQEES